MTDTSTSADFSSVGDSADTSTDAAPSQADSYDEGDGDYESLPDYGEIDELDEGDADYASLPDYGGQDDLDPELSYDELPDPDQADPSSEPQPWAPDETVQLHADDSPGGPPDNSSAVEAARGEVAQAIDQSERQQEARDAVDAAFAQAEADGVPPNTIEQFEAEAQQAIDDAPSDTGAKEVEFKESNPTYEADPQAPDMANRYEPTEASDPEGVSSSDGPRATGTDVDGAESTPIGRESAEARHDQPAAREGEPLDVGRDEPRDPRTDAAQHNPGATQTEQEVGADPVEVLGGGDDRQMPADQDGQKGESEVGTSEHNDHTDAVDSAKMADAGEPGRDTPEPPDANPKTDLTPAELSALQDYTALAYEPVNSALWRGSIDDVSAIADLSHDLSAALDKMPTYEGQVIRGSQPGRPVEAYDLSRYEPGETVIENGYISATTNQDGLLAGFDGPVAWVIESSSGRDISSVSSVDGESEVLFDRFSSFTVLSKEFDPTSGPDGTWIIYMQEEDRD